MVDRLLSGCRLQMYAWLVGVCVCVHMACAVVWGVV